MRSITKEQMEFISGGLEAGPGYGAQANGFQPNVSAGANGMGLFQDSLSNSVAGGMIAGSAGGPVGIALGALGGMVAGGAFNGFGSATGSSNSGS